MTSLSSNQKSETEKDAENNMSTFLIIDQDELSKNDTQIIQNIKDDYERRLQEQLTLAKQDFVNELERQFQVSCVPLCLLKHAFSLISSNIIVVIFLIIFLRKDLGLGLKGCAAKDLP